MSLSFFSSSYVTMATGCCVPCRRFYLFGFFFFLFWKGSKDTKIFQLIQKKKKNMCKINWERYMLEVCMCVCVELRFQGHLNTKTVINYLVIRVFVCFFVCLFFLLSPTVLRSVRRKLCLNQERLGIKEKGLFGSL